MRYNVCICDHWFIVKARSKEEAYRKTLRKFFRTCLSNVVDRENKSFNPHIFRCVEFDKEVVWINNPKRPFGGYYDLDLIEHKELRGILEEVLRSFKLLPALPKTIVSGY